MSNVEDHYAEVIDIINDLGPEAKELGIGVAWAYHDDPRHLLFTLSRYKFVSKMFDGMNKVLEIGCGDGFASRLLLQNISSLVAIDIDKLFIDDARRRQSKTWPIDFRIHDILDDGPIDEGFDGVVSCDVMEHIPSGKHQLFLDNICLSLNDGGCAIIGMPSIESQKYASERSKIGHVSCLDQKTFKETLQKKFQRVFIFSMNDELVHTGYSSMSHYNLALCIKN
tara:strand:- start:469 stop:1143 length:675 start_codon:yes stop_codon:yes gene_type:complete